jgi:NADH-quinone oxidoreductase subunit J
MPVTAVLAAATLPDALTFAIAAVICVVGALGVVFSRHPVHSALMLVMTLFGIAVLFVEEDAQFLAAVQIIVYAGAIVVLFLFVIMLLGVARQDAAFHDPIRGQRPAAVFLGLCVLAEVIILGTGHWSTGAHAVAGKLEGQGPNVNVLGKSLFTSYLLPFEVTSALLIVAVVAAVVLSRENRHPGGLPEIGERPEPDGAEPAATPPSERDAVEHASDDVVVPQ